MLVNITDRDYDFLLDYFKLTHPTFELPDDESVLLGLNELVDSVTFDFQFSDISTFKRLYEKYYNC